MRRAPPPRRYEKRPGSGPSPTFTPMPRSSATTPNPSSSVRSSPANTGRRPAKGASRMNSRITVPLSPAAGFASTTILPSMSRKPARPVSRSSACAISRRHSASRSGGPPVVQRERHPLVLDHQTRVVGRQPRERDPQGIEGPGMGRPRTDLTARTAAFEPVHPGRGQARRREKGIQLDDRAAAHQRERTAEDAMERHQGSRQGGIHPDPIRHLGDLRQGAVEVQEQRPALVRGRERQAAGSLVSIPVHAGVRPPSPAGTLPPARSGAENASARG